jgi:hypothetical protein
LVCIRCSLISRKIVLAASFFSSERRLYASLNLSLIGYCGVFSPSKGAAGVEGETPARRSLAMSVTGEVVLD